MAIKLSAKPNTEPISGAYPYGAIRDNTGSNNGTPVNKLVYDDLHQFFERMMAQAGITHNGLPDNATNGFQLFTALIALFGGRRAVVNIGSWDMDTDASINVANPLTGVDETNITGVTAMILDDDQTSLRSLTSGGGIAGTIQGGVFYDNGIGSPNRFSLRRTTGGTFDSSSFNNGAINRGFIIVEYTV